MGNARATVGNVEARCRFERYSNICGAGIVERDE